MNRRAFYIIPNIIINGIPLVRKAETKGILHNICIQGRNIRTFLIILVLNMILNEIPLVRKSQSSRYFTRKISIIGASQK